MQKLLNFLEGFSVEKNFYTIVPDIYGEQEWEIYWNKYHTNSLWGLKRRQEKTYAYYKQAELLHWLGSYKVNLDVLEDELLLRIKTMIAYTYVVQDEAYRQFGKDFLVETKEEFGDFAKSLVEAIQELVPAGDSAASEKKPSLQIIR